MAETTAIEWADATFNPWEGCFEVSPACDGCYARERDKRWHGGKHWGKDAPRLMHTDAYWQQPLKWNAAAKADGRARRVFCGSLCDVMEKRESLQAVRETQLYPLIRRTDWLIWLLLTKRPQEFHRQFFRPQKATDNVWGMTTVESQDFAFRIGHLMNEDFPVYGISAEPLVGNLRLPAEFLALGKRGWVITGGESQAGPTSPARASQLSSVRYLRDQCVEAGVPFNFKQWGEYDSGLVKLGKKHTGRLLDGRTWDEVPPVDRNGWLAGSV